MSDLRIYHTFKAQNILDMLSDFGGLLGLIIVAFEFLAEFLNEKVIKAKFIRSLFYVKKASNLLPKFKVNLGDTYLHKKLGSYSPVMVKAHNMWFKRPNKN